ncbi:hypothetical protein [Lunatimonas salinarum]|uniref:hypothetical protein n=1 Tax=Lunatimonas salinarum TaxID=1774590 RepID=UPI001AE0A470|nr:hypothetical protein [Lunatimonas salinarum]
MNKLFLPIFFLVLIGSCTSKPQELDESKTRLENEIRGQVKILDEPESFSSISDKMVEYKIPSISIAVITQGEIVPAPKLIGRKIV